MSVAEKLTLIENLEDEKRADEELKTEQEIEWIQFKAKFDKVLKSKDISENKLKVHSSVK